MRYKGQIGQWIKILSNYRVNGSMEWIGAQRSGSERRLPFLGSSAGSKGPTFVLSSISSFVAGEIDNRYDSTDPKHYPSQQNH